MVAISNMAFVRIADTCLLFKEKRGHWDLDLVLGSP